MNPSPEGAGDLPDGWQWKTVEELASNEPRSITDGPFGSKLKTAHYTYDGPRVIRLQNIGDGQFLDAKAHISEEHYQTLRNHKVDAGDIVIAAMGEDPPRACIVPSTLGPAIVKADCIRFKPDPIHSTKFLEFALNSPGTRRRAKVIVHGVGRPRLNQGEIKEILLPVAPPDEQRRIVARIEELFSRLDAGVAALRHAKAQLQRYRQAVLAAAVTGQLTQAWREQHPDTEPAEELLERILEQRREQWDGKGKYRDALGPDSPSELPEIPANWIWTTLDSLCISKVGNAFKSAQFKDAGVRLLRGENIEPGALRWANTRYWPESNIAEFQDLLVDQGDVIIAMDRPLISSGLKVAVAKKEDTPCLLVQRVTRLRPIDSITSTFIFTNINTKRFVDQLIGNQTGTQIPHITEKGIRCFAIPLPPLAEQHQIVAEVEARTTAINHLEAELDRQITRSNRLRQSTLKTAFCGQLR
jgi:type I restriction enzyme S subunit